ncbi:MAG: TonB-dependent receptor [Prevotella sp.]|jgi:iron complex outermembrane receptor protein
MYKKLFNRRKVLKFKRFSNKGYSLFSVLGREVLVGTLSVATLAHAKAAGISTRTDLVNSDSTVVNASHELQEVSVMGTRAPLTQSQQARMVTVLSREEIQSAPVQSVNDVLKLVAGVDVRQKGPLGALTDVSIRGGSSEQIAVLLNGINIGDAQTAHNVFDLPVDKDDIERIEVLEGPAARVYGTSSLVGAINIVTRKRSLDSRSFPDGAAIPNSSHPTLNPEASAHLEGGSYGYLQAGARGALNTRRFYNSLSASYTRSDGYLRSTSGHLSADYKTGKAFYQGAYNNPDVELFWHAGLSIKDYGSNTFYSVNYDNQFEHTLKTTTALQAETKRGWFHLRPSVYWNRNMDRFELIRGDESKVPFNYHRTDIFGANLNAWFDSPLGRTALGVEMRYEDLVSTTLGETLSRPHHVHHTSRDYTKGVNRTNVQLVVEHNVVLRNFTLSAGITAVDNSLADMNMRVYPGVDVSWRFAEGWKLYAGYNSSLRMPSFTELYYSVGGHKADSHLKPEELSAIEAGVKYNRGGINAVASLFYNHYKNLIDWINDGSTDESGQEYWQSVNFGKINALGVEANVALDFRVLLPHQKFLKSFSAGWCWINQEQDEEEGIISKYALEYLRNKLTAAATFNLWRNLDLQANWRLQHREGQYKDLEGNTHRYQTYGLLDARLSWTEPRWSVYIEGNNVLDRDYVDYGNVKQPGFWFVAGANIRL